MSDINPPTGSNAMDIVTSTPVKASPQGACPFVDKVPSEVRLKIFGHLLQSDYTLVHGSQTPAYADGHG